MDELERLARTRLSQPCGIRKFAIQVHKNVHFGKLNGYVSTYQIWHKKLIKRTFAVKKVNRKILVQEVCRKMEGGKYSILCHIENRSMAGNIVDWTKDGKWETKRLAWATCCGWYYGGKNNWNFDGSSIMCDLEGYKKLMEKLEIPYCAYDHPNFDNYRPYFDFLKYIELYRKYPKIELLVKLGAPQLITGAKYFNFKAKSFDKIFKISNYWQQYLNELSVKGILNIRKNQNINSIEIYRVFEKFNSKFNSYSKIKKYFKQRHVDYLNKNDFSWSMYNDYLYMAEQLGYPLNENRFLFPDDLKEAHDQALKESNPIRYEKLDKGIKENADKYRKFNFKDSKYLIRIAESQEELIEESYNNDNCVRTYADRVARNETHIFFLRTSECPDNSLVTVELKNKKITQAFAYNNSSIDDGCRNFLIKWCKKFRFDAKLL